MFRAKSVSPISQNKQIYQLIRNSLALTLLDSKLCRQLYEMSLELDTVKCIHETFHARRHHDIRIPNIYLADSSDLTLEKALGCKVSNENKLLTVTIGLREFQVFNIHANLFHKAQSITKEL